MEADELRAITHRFYSEVFNQGKLELIDELIADDFVEHEEMPGMPTDKRAPRMFIGMMREAFPDINATVEDMVVEGNTVAVRARMSGTHKGEFMGIPPTGNKFDIQAMDVIRYRNGQVCAHWGVTDSLTMMQQLDVIAQGPPG
jgi:steroid delta-isomerase-like uncharacterized protein